MKVAYVRPGKSRGFLRIGITSGDEKNELSVSESDYAEAGSPMTGDEIFADALELITLSDMRYRAKLYALRILSYADNNEKNLCRKLVAKGVSREIALEVAKEMVVLGYIREDDQLHRLITEEINRKHTGPRKLVAKLSSKGYSPGAIRRTLDGLLKSGEVDIEAAKAALLAKKLTRDATDEEIKAILYKNGFDIC